MKKIKIGLIGAGFMGHTHAKAYKSITNIYGDEVVPELVAVADVDENKAKALMKQYGFQRYTSNWQELMEADDIDLIDITTPNSSHCPLSIEAAKNNKHVYCEKPLSMNAEEAINTTALVENKKIITSVGFNYIYNPIQQYVKSLIDSGELGEVMSFRGTFDQDFYNEPEQKHEWRMFKSASASGALGDLASHTLSLSQFLVGDITKVNGMTQIFVSERPDPNNPTKMLPVENDDLVQFMFQYHNGASGVIVSNRLASGRKMALGYEIQLTKGNIVYTQERQNEVNIYRHCDSKTERGFKNVFIAPGHGDYDKFYGGAGIGLGYADQKTIEVYHTLKAISENKPCNIDFRFATKVMKVIDAVLQSSKTGAWVEIKN